MSLPVIVSHRGAKRETPENTASAFNKALTYPINGIELDVQLTRDKIPVIYHDRTIWKVTRKRDRIKDYTYEELLNKDFGKWYDTSFTGEKILTLQETLDLLFDKTDLYVEIKSRGWDRNMGTSEILTRITTSLLRGALDNQQGNKRKIHILSFDKKVLELAHSLESDWRYVLNIVSPSQLSEESLNQSDFLWGVCTNINRLTLGFVNAIHAIGKKALTYTCNTPKQVKLALKTEMDVVMTDDPKWLFTWFKEKGIV
ncbi:MAG: hypothetical protein HQK83_02985 [Fibrobacteria bacterium]|nr:hypothetical protein [Fibrobacteria bacterium]